MLEAFSNFIKEISISQIILTIVPIYGITMNIIKRLNKDKDDVVPLFDTLMEIPLKIQRITIEYYNNKKEVLKAKVEADKEMEKYKKYKNKKRQIKKHSKGQKEE